MSKLGVDRQLGVDMETPNAIGATEFLGGVFHGHSHALLMTMKSADRRLFPPDEHSRHTN